ncbi:hypothetical protein PENTCL1PPCAC_13869, partial [Pristionchus entomophagus]
LQSLRKPRMEAALGRMAITQPRLETNVYRIRKDTAAVFRYSVGIDKVIHGKRKIDHIQLSRAGGMDAIRIPRQRVCVAILKKLSEEFADPVWLYEGSATLFTTEPLPADVITKEVPVHLVQRLVDEGLMNEEDYRMHIKDASSILIKLSSDGGMQNITSMVRKSVEEDQLIVDFLATLAREHAPNDQFVAFRGGKLIEHRKVKDITFGAMRVAGISMGVRAVRDDKDGGAPAMALDIDVTEATLYQPGPLVQSICQYFGASPDQLRNHYGNPSTMRDVERYMRDIPVRYEHTDKTLTSVTGFKWDESGHCVHLWSSEVCKDDEEARKYAGSAVVVEEFKGGDGKIYFRHYPLNGLHVLPNTKVPKEKQKGAKPRPVIPRDRFMAMQKARKDIHIDQQNETMQKWGTSIDVEPVRVDQRRLDAPKIMGKQAGRLYELKTDGLKHNWRSDNAKFTKGARIDSLYFAYQSGHGLPPPQQMGAYAAAHVACCKTKGMEVLHFDGNQVTDLDHLENIMRAFAAHRDGKRQGGAEYRAFLILIGEKNPVWHDSLKSLEQKYAVQTQHVFADTVKKILAKPESARARDFTLFNIVMKTNVKAGGENIHIEEIRGNSLFPSSGGNSPVSLIVGLDVAHPPPLSRHQLMKGVAPDPSCIGISSNCMTTNLQTYTGYEVYTESRKEAATDSIMSEVGRHLIEKFIENQGLLPSNVVYFRDGIDKGQYDRVKDEFASLMSGMREKLAITESEEEFSPREVIVLGTKRHNVRAYEVTKAGINNVKAGTVIDMGIISPYYPEFFLYASHALIGTAKAVQCTILRDTSEEELRRYPEGKLQDMEKFVHALAFSHQICDSPTSLPEPLYNAHETAKRGSANYKVHKNGLEVRELISTEELTKKLSNRDTELAKVKYNA